MNTVLFDSKSVTPSKVICIGRNYVEHAKELGNEIPDEPVIFIKPNSSISDHLYAGTNEAIHFEGEIAFIIESQQLAGVGFGFDLTKRELQSTLKNKGLPWERAKAFDQAAVFSSFVRFDDDVIHLNLKLVINDKLVQQGGVELMIFKPDFLLNEIIKSFKLEDGDIIMTGTPAGAGAFNQGDNFIGQIFIGDKLLVKQEWITK